MAWPLPVVLIMVCLGLVALGLSNAVFYELVGEVNAASTAEHRISFWKMGFKSLGVLRVHRKLFPNSRKRSRMTWLSAIGGLMLVGAMIVAMVAKNAGWIL